MDTQTTHVSNNSPDYNQIIDLVSKSRRDNHVGLPGDLVVQILCKLPAKSLLRFKTVCKSWKILISSPVFISTHLHIQKPQFVGFAIESRNNPFPFTINYIVGAHNGFVCFKTSNNQNPLVLCNPSTREFSFLPDECRGDFYGFCYLSELQEYQVMAFTKRTNSSSVDITILTLGKTKSLRNVEEVLVPGLITSPKQATSGTRIFWLGLTYRDNKVIAIWYDVMEERFSWIDVPLSVYMSGTLRVLDDSVIIFGSPPSHEFFEMWTLIMDDGSKNKSWSRYRKIGPFETGVIIINPIDVYWYDRHILCWTWKKNWEKGLSYYDLETNQVKDCEVTSPYTMEYVNNVDCLVPIKSLGIDSNHKQFPCMKL